MFGHRINTCSNKYLFCLNAEIFPKSIVKSPFIRSTFTKLIDFSNFTQHYWAFCVHYLPLCLSLVRMHCDIEMLFKCEFIKCASLHTLYSHDFLRYTSIICVFGWYADAWVRNATGGSCHRIRCTGAKIEATGELLGVRDLEASCLLNLLLTPTIGRHPGIWNNCELNRLFLRIVYIVSLLMKNSKIFRHISSIRSFSQE